MADNTAKVNIVAEDKGSFKELVGAAKILRRELEAAAKAAGRVATPVSQAKTALGSRPAAARSQGAQDAEASNITRSLGPGTGAAGRDFAKQAAGMGGLVQIYATFAANLFAAGAAFRALSAAADFTNLVKGLDQLGAASGRNLGSLAKQITAVTDGAVSMQEAMRTTAQASAGGMSGTNILRMAAIAKDASQALGREMPDALNRLTRGITKLEPELLDEIGIMVRLDDAVKTYATSLGKASSSLTDFERRQAFANAVLDQGEKKFGAIELEANQYAKLLASVQNTAMAFGEGLNTVLSPILKLLNSSPMALAGALTAIAAILIRQAIPALTTWQSRIKQFNEEQKAASLAALDTRNKFALLRKAKLEDAEASKVGTRALRAEAAARSSIERLVEGPVKKRTLDLLSEVDQTNITQKQVEALKKQAAARKALAESNRNMSAETRQNARIESEAITRVVSALERRKVAEEAYNRVVLENNKSIGYRIKNFFTEEQITSRLYQKEKNRANRAEVVSTALTNSAELGAMGAIKAAWSDIGDRIDKTGKYATETAGRMSKLQGVMAGIAATTSVAARAAGMLLSSLSAIFMYIGIVVAGFQLLNSWLTKNEKEIQKFDTAISQAEASVSNMDKTLEAIAKKDPFERMSIDSLQARANALNDITDSVDSLVTGFDRVIKTSSGWTNFWDSVFDVFGAGRADKVADNMSAMLIAAFDSVSKGPVKDKAEKAIKDIFEIDNLEFKTLREAMDKMDTATLVSKLSRVKLAMAEMNKTVNESAANMTAFQAGLKETSDQVKNSIAALVPKDEFYKLGDAVTQQSYRMEQALLDPTTALQALNALAKDTATLALINPQTSVELSKAADALKTLTTQQESFKENIKKTEEAMSKLKPAYDLYKKAQSRERGTNVPQQTVDKGLEYERLASVVEAQKKALAENANNIKEYVTDFGAIGQQMFEKGAKLLEKSINRGYTQLGIDIQTKLVGIFKQLGINTTEMEFKISKEEIELRRSAIEAQYENTLAVNKLTAIQELIANQNTVARLEAREARGDILSKEESDLLVQASKAVQGLSIAVGILGENSITAMKRVVEANKSAERGTPGAIAVNALRPTLNAAGNMGLANSRANAERDLASLTRSLGLSKEAYQLEKDSYEYSRKRRDIDRERINVLEQAVDIITIGTTTAKENLALTNLEQEQKRQIRDIEEERLAVYKALAYSIATGKTEEAEQAKDYLLRLATREQELRVSQEADIVNANISKTAKIINAELVYERVLREENNTMQALAFEQYNNAIDAEQQLIALSEKMYGIRDTIYKKRLDDLASLKLEAQYRENLRKTEYEYANTLLGIEAKRKALKDSGQENTATGKDQAAELDRQKKAAEDLFNLKKKGYDEELAAKNSILEKTKELYKWEILTSDLTNTLGLLFKDLGVNIATFVTELAKGSAGYSEMIKKQEEQQKTAEDGMALEVMQLAHQEERAKYEREITAQALSNSKKLFKEKTAAYKVISAAEKAYYTYKFLMDNKEMILDATKTAQAVANSIIRSIASNSEATSNAGTAITNQGKGDPYTAWARMAAMAVFVGAILAQYNKKSSSVSIPGGVTSADKQETQGTGMAWVGGQKVETGYGVYGDPAAKSESIARGIEILNDNTIEGLKYDRSMLKALEDIRDSMESLAKLTYGMKGIRTGSGFGTVEGTQKGGWFSKKVSTSIIASGLMFEGSFADFANMTEAASIKLYEDVQTTTKKWYGKTSSSITRNIKEVDDAFYTEVSMLFKDARGIFENIAKNAGMDVQAVLKQFDISGIDLKDLDLRGLKGDEIVSAIEAYFGSELDRVAQTVFAQFADYRKFGEGMLETAIRVTDGFSKVTVALKAAGLNVTDILQNFNYAVTEAIIDDAGGLDKFTEQISFFRENFLTESERLAPVMDNVVTTLAEIGYSGVDTREEFAAIVKSLDLTTQTGRDTYKALMDVAPAFAEVYDELEKANNVLKDLKKETEDLTDALFKLVAPMALYEQYAIRNYTEEEKAQYFINKGLKEQIDVMKQVSATRQEHDTKFMTDAEKLIYTRNKEREAISETNLALFDLTTELMQAQQAVTEATNAMLAGYAKVVEKANKAKSALLSVAQQGLQILEQEATNLMNKLVSLAQQGQQILQQALDDAIANRNNLAQAGYDWLVNTRTEAEQQLADLTNTLVDGYSSALSAQEEAQAAYNAALEQDAKAAADAAREQENEARNARNALRDFSVTLKEFVRDLALGEDGIADFATKFRIANQAFEETLAKAKMGDLEAGKKLPQVSKDLLEAAKNQARDKIEYARTFARVTSELSDVSLNIDTKYGTEQEKLLEATNDQASAASAAAIALGEANSALAQWTAAVNASGVDVQTIIAKRKFDASPEGIAARIQQTNQTIATTNSQIETWLETIGPELASIVTATDPATFAQFTAAFSAAGIQITAANTDLVNWVTEINAILRTAGVAEGDLLTLAPSTPTIADIQDSIDTTSDLLSLSRTNIALYIETTNALLRAAGFSEEDLLTAASPITIESVYAKRDEAVAAFGQALVDVQTWEQRLTELGISFTPYGATNDPSLTELANGVIAANAAFDSANNKIQEWIDSIVDTINDIVTGKIPEDTTPVVYNPPGTKTAPEVSNPPTQGPTTQAAGSAPRTIINSGITAVSDSLDLYWIQWSDGTTETVDYATYASAKGISYYDQNRYAKGGMFGGGYRLVGEEGPELEATGPSRIFNAEQTTEILRNTANPNDAMNTLVSEIKNLKTEIAQLRYAAQQTETNTRKSKDILQRVTRDGQTLEVSGTVTAL